MGGWIDRSKGEWMDDRLMEEQQVDGWMNGWTERKVNEWMTEQKVNG